MYHQLTDSLCIVVEPRLRDDDACRQAECRDGDRLCSTECEKLLLLLMLLLMVLLLLLLLMTMIEAQQLRGVVLLYGMKNLSMEWLQLST